MSIYRSQRDIGKTIKSIAVALAVSFFAGNTICAFAQADDPAAQAEWERIHFAGQKAYDQGNYAEAETQLKSALSIAQRLGVVGPLGMSHYHLGKVYHAEKKYAEAETNYKQAMEIYENGSRKRSTTLYSVVTDYAKLLRETGREQEAIDQEARLKPKTSQ